MRSEMKRKVAFGVSSVAVTGRGWVALGAQWRGGMSPWYLVFSGQLQFLQSGLEEGIDSLGDGINSVGRLQGKNMQPRKMGVNNGVEVSNEVMIG